MDIHQSAGWPVYKACMDSCRETILLIAKKWLLSYRVDKEQSFAKVPNWFIQVSSTTEPPEPHLLPFGYMVGDVTKLPSYSIRHLTKYFIKHLEFLHRVFDKVLSLACMPLLVGIFPSSPSTSFSIALVSLLGFMPSYLDPILYQVQPLMTRLNPHSDRL